MRSDAQPPRSGGGSRTRNFRSVSTPSIYPDPASSQQAFEASGRAAERYLAASAPSLGLAPWLSARDAGRPMHLRRVRRLPDADQLPDEIARSSGVKPSNYRPSGGPRTSAG